MVKKAFYFRQKVLRKGGTISHVRKSGGIPHVGEGGCIPHVRKGGGISHVREGGYISQKTVRDTTAITQNIFLRDRGSIPQCEEHTPHHS